MTGDDIIRTIRKPKIKKQLQEYGIKHLWLFGSYARGEENEESDIDFLYDADYEQMFKTTSRGGSDILVLLKGLFKKEMDLIAHEYIDKLIAEYINQDKRLIF